MDFKVDNINRHLYGYYRFAEKDKVDKLMKNNSNIMDVNIFGINGHSNTS